MISTQVENDHYRISKDDEKAFLYVALLDSNSTIEVEKNIASNILSFCMQMPKYFRFILDLRLLDPRNKSEWFQANMDRVGKRMGELNAGPQAHILNDILWYRLYNDYPQIDGMYPVIFEDNNTKELIGRFNTVEEAEAWLNTLP